MLGSPILYFKGMRILMFQLSRFYCRGGITGLGCSSPPGLFHDLSITAGLS